jgi:copper oxidase (laccase) domain-containing protein
LTFYLNFDRFLLWSFTKLEERSKKMLEFDDIHEYRCDKSLIRYAIRGVNYGNHRGVAEGSTERIVNMAKAMHVKTVIRPKLKFTNIVHADRETLVKQDEIDGVTLLSTPVESDAVFVNQPGTGVFIANGDCLVCILYARNVMVVCHVGLECLLHERSIIDRAFDALGAYFHNPLVFEATGIIAFGAGPCCYGIPASAAVHDRIKRRFAHGDVSVVRGPRAGTRAIDLVSLSAQNCERSPSAFHSASYRFKGLHVTGSCTSCAGFIDPNVLGYGTYFSNLRDDREKPNMGRNGVMVTLH